MTATMQYTGTLTIIQCATKTCRMRFAVPQDFEEDRRRDHDTFWCPRGHSLVFNGESDIEKAERLRRNAEQRTRWAEARESAARDQAEAAERSARAYRGHLTRIRNKVANGVCPVSGCRRHFDNVQAHIASQHPSWSVIDPETGKAAVL